MLTFKLINLGSLESKNNVYSPLPCRSVSQYGEQLQEEPNPLSFLETIDQRGEGPLSSTEEQNLVSSENSTLSNAQVQSGDIASTSTSVDNILNQTIPIPTTTSLNSVTSGSLPPTTTHCAVATSETTSTTTTTTSCTTGGVYYDRVPAEDTTETSTMRQFSYISPTSPGASASENVYGHISEGPRSLMARSPLEDHDATTLPLSPKSPIIRPFSRQTQNDSSPFSFSLGRKSGSGNQIPGNPTSPTTSTPSYAEVVPKAQRHQLINNGNHVFPTVVPTPSSQTNTDGTSGNQDKQEINKYSPSCSPPPVPPRKPTNNNPKILYGSVGVGKVLPTLDTAVPISPSVPLQNEIAQSESPYDLPSALEHTRTSRKKRESDSRKRRECLIVNDTSGSSERLPDTEGNFLQEDEVFLRDSETELTARKSSATRYSAGQPGDGISDERFRVDDTAAEDGYSSPRPFSLSPQPPTPSLSVVLDTPDGYSPLPFTPRPVPQVELDRLSIRQSRSPRGPSSLSKLSTSPPVSLPCTSPAPNETADGRVSPLVPLSPPPPPPLPPRTGAAEGGSESGDNKPGSGNPESTYNRLSQPSRQPGHSPSGQYSSRFDVSAGGTSLRRKLTLKEEEVSKLDREIVSQEAISVRVPITDAATALAVVEFAGSLWVAGWMPRMNKRLAAGFHIGDMVVLLNGHQVRSLHQYAMVLKNSVNSIASITEFMLADRNGIRATGPSFLGRKTPGGTVEEVPWVLTEVNNRPLNLFAKKHEAEQRLEAIGLEISLLLQPKDFVKFLKQQLKAKKNFKEFLIG